MADQVIASLVGRLSFEVDPKGLQAFNKGMDEGERASKSAGVAAVAYGSILANLAGQAAGAAIGLGRMAITLTRDSVMGFVTSGAAIGDWSKKLGIASGELQRLEYAGKATGASTDNVRKAAQKLQENLGGLARSGTGPAAEALGTLGLKLGDLEKLSTTEQFGQIGQAIQALPTDAQRTSVALQLLGEDGAALMPLMLKGSAGIERLTSRADRLGAVLDDQAIRTAGEAREAFAELGAVTDGLANTLAAKLAPKAVEIAERIQGWVAKNEDLIETKISEYAEAAADAFETFVEVGGEVVDIAGDMVDAVGGLDNAMVLAAVAAGGITIALGGIPAAMAAAVVAIGLGINELAGFSAEARRLREETREIEAGGARKERAIDARFELARHRAEGTLGSLSNEDYDALIRDVEGGDDLEKKRSGGFGHVVNARGDRQSTTAVSLYDQQRSKQQAKAEAAAAFDRVTDPAALVDLTLGPELRRRAKKYGIGDPGVEGALDAARAKLRAGSTLDAAEQAAIGSLDGLRAKPGKGGKSTVDTREAEALFGDQIKNLAQAAGLGATAIKASMEAAATSLKRGSTRTVALQAATSSLESLSGQKLVAAGSPDAALFGLLTQIGGAEAARSATDGARFVRIDQSQNNTITVNVPESFAQTLTPAGAAEMFTDAVRSILSDEYRQVVEHHGGRSVSP